MEKNQQIATTIMELVGGTDNISFVTHCMTRLRLNLKDESIVDDNKVKAVKGVLGIAHSGGQYQIIIGQNVPKVYKAVCEMGGFKQEGAIEENPDAPKEKLTLKTIGSNIMNYMSGSMTQLIPGMIAAAMFKTLLVVLGPDMMNVITPENDLYILLDFVY
ncbi:PTS transporter subunit EIIB, partial [uncultured Dubosiella sp.]